jgi:enoyl-CoA hydratase/carnithine racemase
MADKIILQIKGNIAEIKLNNAQKLNCMGFEMLEALDEAVVQIAANPTVRVLLFTGAGERAFSTGADLKEFKSLSGERADHWIEFGNLVFNKIETLPKPTVALVHGYVMGGGMELALACDFRLGKVNAIFSAPELQHGWLPGWGGMTRLRRLIGEARAKEVVMLNERITTKEALRLGLLTRILIFVNSFNIPEN